MFSKLQYFKPSLLKRSFSLWQGVPMGPTDPILGIAEAYKKDTSPNKVDLSVGAYRGDDGKPWLLPSVKQADKILTESNYNYEYLPIIGHLPFIEESIKLAFGDTSQVLKDRRVAAVQSLSGTGACRVGTEFCKRFLGDRLVYVPNPTWPNHKNIATDSGLKWKEYRYWNPKTKGLDINGLLDDLTNAPEGSIVYLHACAHNPTGVDPNEQEWKAIMDVFKKKHHIPFFDMAYQGYTSGDTDKDARFFRMFVDNGLPCLLAQSFAKNFGLYGQRVGAFSIICDNPEEKEKVLSQLKLIIRPMYSNPPLAGARIIETILKDPKLKSQWHQEIKSMSNRINSMRQKLVDELKNLGNPHDWSHVVKQQGMFAYTGLTVDQSKELAEKHHIYMIHGGGRISVAGLNTGNVATVAKAFDAVTRNSTF